MKPEGTTVSHKCQSAIIYLIMTRKNKLILKLNLSFHLGIKE